jgi:sugar/nucleoside kinase (ribokinase family)
MLGTVGDLIQDVVVLGADEIHRDADTPCTITHRRGGSAANVAATAALLGTPARFIGQTGDDPTGTWLRAELTTLGVEVAGHRGGRSGTVVALIASDGGRSMLTDRGSAADLDHPDPAWLDGLLVLHVPFYSLAGGPLGRSSRQLISWAGERDIAVSIDASSTTAMRDFGIPAFVELVASYRPAVVLCNADEAEALGAAATPAALGAAAVVVKRGAEPTEVRWGDRLRRLVDVPFLAHLHDTTGAGDAFAAGYLSAQLAGADPFEAAAAGNRTAVGYLADLTR